MTAFSSSQASQIRENIVTLGKRLKVASAKRITDDEFLQLFVAEEHHDAFKRVGPLLWKAKYPTHHGLGWPDGTPLNFLLQNTKLPIPKELALQPSAPAALVQSITHWIANNGDASRDTGRVAAVFSRLNENCSSKQELRYYWPGILTLLSTSENRSDLIELGKQLADVKVPKNPAPLYRDMRMTIKKASETVAVMSLIPHDISERPSTGITITVSDGVRHTEPGIGTYFGAYLGG